MAGKFIDATLRFIDNFTGPMNQAIHRMEESAKTYQKAGKQIQAAGNGIANVGKSLTATITTPIVGLGVAAVKTAADFEASMDKVQSIAGVSSDEMSLLTEKAKEMGAKTKFSASEAADAFSYMAMAGWKTTDMMNGIEGVMYLAGATGEDLAQTSDIVTDALTAFGMTASDTNRFVDVLAKASSNANTNVGLMGETFKYVAPSAGALGYSVEDTAVAIGLMANSGIKASQAGTSLNSLLTRLAKPTKESQKAMSALGLSLTDSEGNMKSFATIMGDMRKGFAGLTEEQKTQYAAMLAGKTGMAGLLGIVNASESDFEKLTQAIADSNGAAKEMYDVANDNLAGQLTIIKSTIESIAITFGEKLLPYVKQGAEKLQGLADKVNNLNDAQVSNIIKWAGIAAAIGPAILVFGKVVIGIGKVVSVIGKMGAAIKAAGGVVALFTGPAGIVIGVVAALAAVAVLVYKNWDKVKEFFVSFGKNVVSVFNQCGEPISGFVSKFDSIKEKIPRIVQGIKDIWEIAGPYVQKFGELCQFVFSVHLASFIGGAVGLFNSLANTVMGVVDGIVLSLGGFVDFVAGALTGDTDRAMQGFKDMWSGHFQALVALCKAPINAVIGVINGMVTQINKIGIKIPDWSPWNPGKNFSVNVPKLTYLYKGTNNWGGGPAMIHDRGAEIVDLPKGTRVYPHDKSLQMARAEGSKSVVVNIPKLADSIVIREDADIERLMDAFARKLDEVAPNMA